MNTIIVIFGGCLLSVLMCVCVCVFHLIESLFLMLIVKILRSADLRMSSNRVLYMYTYIVVSNTLNRTMNVHVFFCFISIRLFEVIQVISHIQPESTHLINKPIKLKALPMHVCYSKSTMYVSKKFFINFPLNSNCFILSIIRYYDQSVTVICCFVIVVAVAVRCTILLLFYCGQTKRIAYIESVRSAHPSSTEHACKKFTRFKLS